MYKNDITGQPIAVSNKSQLTIVKALTAAWRNGTIDSYEYSMTYAEVCEIGFYPQAFGGGPVDPEELRHWKAMKSWAHHYGKDGYEE